MIWTINLEAAISETVTDHSEAVWSVMEQLVEVHGVMGAVGHGNSKHHTVGARFDIEAESLVQAATDGVQIFTAAASRAGIETMTVLRAEVEEDEHFMARTGAEHELAPA